MHSSAGSPAHQCRPSLLEELEKIGKAVDDCRHLTHVRSLVNGWSGEALTLTAAARAIGVSHCHLARLFQQKAGTSFLRWLTLRRLRVAVQLMHERPATSLETGELGGRVGTLDLPTAGATVPIRPNLQIIGHNLQIFVQS